jgi:DNA repair protein RadD
MPADLFLREYQHGSVDALRANIRADIRNQILCAPTGSGKTIIAAYLLKECFAKGRRAVFVCDRISLIDQTSALLDNFGIDHGVIQADHWRRRPGERIQIASAQTLQHRGWPATDLIIIDEAHSVHQCVVDRIKARDIVVIGLTATPLTKGLGKHYDAVVSVTTANKLTKDGFLTPFRVFAASEPDMTGCKAVAGEWTDKDARERSMPIIGDCVAEYHKHAAGKKFIAFGVDVAHCEEMQRQFLASGVMAALYTYQTPDAERSANVAEFRKPDSTIRGLISVAALSRGFDVPDVECIVMCRPLRSSLSEHIQILGRGLRPHPGKTDCVVLDHSGNFIRFWDAMHDFFENSVDALDDGKPKEKKEPKKAEKQPVKCPRCAHVFPGGPCCPACGYEFPKRPSVQHEAGELRELNGVDHKISSSAKRVLFGELRSIAFARGYKEGWAANKFREFTGVWPNAYKDASLAVPSEETLRRVRASARAWAKQQKAMEMA